MKIKASYSVILFLLFSVISVSAQQNSIVDQDWSENDQCEACSSETILLIVADTTNGKVYGENDHPPIVKDNQMHIFPNPVKKSIWVQWALPEVDHVNIEIYNLDGILIRNMDLGMLEFLQVEIELKGLKPGEYKIKAQIRGAYQTKGLTII